MVKNLAKELAKMSSAERILLAQDLWDSVANDAEAWELTPQQERELDQRLEAHHDRKRSSKSSGASWQTVKRRIRQKT